ncbi:GM20266 [Drosophila sechellia]|uniref:GD25750 n=2 Tax=melanogaster subgroup TaxID=32351 RepID=B4QEF6_DROSI|nr:GM20266 [Drosophila sechellia]EDX06946.1 GD25750 [Drosophila simulans]
MREEDLQLALQMVASTSVSSSLEEENDGAAATSPGNSPKPLRRVLDLSERRKQFRSN